MNRTEHMDLMRGIAVLTARVAALESALFGDPEVAPAPEAKIEGAEIPVEPVQPGHSEPVQQGIVDMQGGWFDAYFGGRKLNSKGLRKPQAEALVQEHIMQHAMAEAAE